MLVPKGDSLTFTLSPSGVASTLYIEGEVKITPLTEELDRKEWSNVFLKDLPEINGNEPTYIKNVAGGFIQIDFDCGDSSGPRSTAPDDANLANMMQKFTIERFTIQGGPSSPSAVEALFSVAKDHKRRLAVFEAYKKSFNYKLSYGYIYGLRGETFSYLTTTGLTVTGTAFTGSNFLIREFDAGVTHIDPKRGTIVAKNWTIVLDKITLIDSQLVY